MSEEQKPNSILKNPEELDRLYALRAKIAKSGNDWQAGDIDDQEQKLKRALIALSLQKHEGITQLLEKASEEIATIDEILLSTEPKDLSSDGAIKYANETSRLFDRKKLWVWFKEFFDTANSDLAETREWLTMNENHTEEE